MYPASNCGAGIWNPVCLTPKSQLLTPWTVYNGVGSSAKLYKTGIVLQSGFRGHHWRALCLCTIHGIVTPATPFSSCYIGPLAPQAAQGNWKESEISDVLLHLNCIEKVFLEPVLWSHQFSLSTTFLQIILASILWLCSKNGPGFSILKNKLLCQFFTLSFPYPT